MKRIKKLNKKAFTLVELLGVMVVVGIISTIAVVAVSRSFNKSREQKDEQNRNNVVIAAEMYFQANRDLLPKGIGEASEVDVKALRKANYLEADITNSKNESCMTDSYVRVVKLANDNYSYFANLYCGEEKRSDSEYDVPEPTVVGFDFNDELKDVTKELSEKEKEEEKNRYTNVKNARFSFKVMGDKDGDKNIGIYSYQYIISVKELNNNQSDYHTVFDSGSIKGNSQSEITVKSEPLSKYIDITGQVKVKVDISVMNDQGGYFNGSYGGESNEYQFEDTVYPDCGQITGGAENDNDWTNKQTYTTGTTTGGKTRGYPSVVTVDCGDGEGSGCKRPDFSRSWPTKSKNEIGNVNYELGARWAYVVIEDNAVNTSKNSKDCNEDKLTITNGNQVKSCSGGNKTVCYVRVNVDIYSPTVNVKVTNPSNGEVVKTITVKDKDEANTINPEETIKADEYKGAEGAEKKEWLNLANFPEGIELSFDAEDQLYLYRWTWETNDAYLPYDTADNLVNKVSLENAAKDGTTIVSGEFEKAGLFKDNSKVTNPDELIANETGPLTGSVTGLKLKLEGKRYGKLTVYDRAGNTSTLHVYANIDRTSPVTPVMTHTMKGHKSTKSTEANYEASNKKYIAAKAGNYTDNTNWSREEIETSIEFQRIDQMVENQTITIASDLSGWWKFSFEYQLQDSDQPKYVWKTVQTVNKGVADMDPSKITDTVYFKDEGTHRIRVLSCDKAKNCSEYSEDDYIKIDYTKPTCTIKETFTNTTGFNEHEWLGLKDGGINAYGSYITDKQTVRLSHNCEDDNYNISSLCNATSPFNLQYFDYDFNIQTEKAGPNGYESTYGTQINDEGDNMNDPVTAAAGGHVVDYAGNISDTCPVQKVQIDYQRPQCTTEISYPQGEPINPSNPSDIRTGWLGLVNGGVVKSSDNRSSAQYTTDKKTAKVKNVCTEIASQSPLLGVESGCDSTSIDEVIYDRELNVSNAGAVDVGNGGEIADNAGNRTICPADQIINSDYTRTKCETRIAYSGGYPINQTDGNSESGWLGLTDNNEYSVSLGNGKKTAKINQICTDPFSSTGCTGSECRSMCTGTMLEYTYDYDINTSKAGPGGPDIHTYTEDKAGNITDCGHDSTPENWHVVKADYQRPVCQVVSTFVDRRVGNSGNYGGQFLGKSSSVTIQSFCDNTVDPGYGETRTITTTSVPDASSGCLPDANSKFIYSSEMKITDATSKGRGMTVYIYDRAGNRSAQPCEEKPVSIDHTGPVCETDAVFGDKNSIDTTTNTKKYDSSLSGMNDFLKTRANFGGSGWVSGTYGIRVSSYCSDDKINGERSPGVTDDGSGCSTTAKATCQPSKRNQETCAGYKPRSGQEYTDNVGSLSKNSSGQSNSAVSSTDEIHHAAYGDANAASGGTDYGTTVDRGKYANLINTVLGFNSGSSSTGTSTSFTDISGNKYAEDIAIAQNNGLTYGTNEEGTIYAPDRAITRAEVAAMIVRGAESSGAELNGTGGNTSFPDYDPNGTQWYVDEVNAAIDGNLFKGFPNTEIKIEEEATVAQTYALLNRAFRNHPDGYVCTIDAGVKGPNGEDLSGKPLESAPYPKNTSGSNWYGDDAREAAYSHTCRKESSEVNTSAGEAATIVDDVGNYTTCDKMEIKIDDKKPSCSINTSGYVYNGGGVYWSKTQSITVSNNCSDGGSGCYSGSANALIDNKECNKANAKATYTPSDLSVSYGVARTQVGYVCKSQRQNSVVYDNVGNKTTCSSPTIGFDQQEPNCSIYAPNDGRWVNYSWQVQPQCNDYNGSGCAALPASKTISGDQNRYETHTFTIKDNVNNTKTCSKNVSQKIDTVKPSVSCSASYNTGYSSISLYFNKYVNFNNGSANSPESYTSVSYNAYNGMSLNCGQYYNFSITVQDQAGNYNSANCGSFTTTACCASGYTYNSCTGYCQLSGSCYGTCGYGIKYGTIKCYDYSRFNNTQCRQNGQINCQDSCWTGRSCTS